MLLRTACEYRKGEQPGRRYRGFRPTAALMKKSVWAKITKNSTLIIVKFSQPKKFKASLLLASYIMPIFDLLKNWRNIIEGFQSL